ncbi:MAG: dihydrodipicolinate reductase [Paracoccaceae bacterium]
MFRTITLLSALAASPVTATEFTRVTDADTFRQIVTGKSLTRPLIRLQVSPQGAIEGRGGTQPVSGQWAWKDGYFCRDLTWGQRDLGYNCQEVRTNGRKIRFRSDKGTGDFADFTLR